MLLMVAEWSGSSGLVATMDVVPHVTVRVVSRKTCAIQRLRWKRWAPSGRMLVSFHIIMGSILINCALMQNGYTSFTPYFKVRKCAFNADSDECKTNCIRKGRYCAADSIGDKFKGKFSGKQVCMLLD